MLEFDASIMAAPFITRTIERNHAIKAEVTFCVRGVISILLSNLYLHYVLDLWFERVVKGRLRAKPNWCAISMTL